MSESNKSVQVSPSAPVKILGPTSGGIYSTSPPIYTSPNSFPGNFPLGGVDEYSVDDLSDSIAYSFPKSKIKVLLLENISATAVKLFERQSFCVETIPKALSVEELKEKIADVHVLGIRSKTKVTAEVLDAAKRLLCVGCFCIGTDQVDLDYAQGIGIPVFNSPFANTRSVAELVTSEIIALSRQYPDRSMELHRGHWNKVSKGCWEVRGKTLGIVGYGHIGTQVAVLAESLGMHVVYYDIIPKLPLGNSQKCETLEELLEEADFVTLHVPKAVETVNLIGEKQIAMMKKGSYLINASRGTVVDLSALAKALNRGHVAGAAIDVFEKEPEKNGPGFQHPLQGCPNTILTPHIGGSTVEAQANIGEEVASALIKLVNHGATINAVNFPNLELPYHAECHRILNIHVNKAGVLRDINDIFARCDTNVRAELLGTTAAIGYLVVDVEKKTSDETKRLISELPASIRTRILY
mmetsp:Transcript_19705/g.28682  ORF Transcript_19705/g.28682 Transcript_19705/m.28682 type:complete len:468 (-) Transcript_19705:97-1500(-)